MKDCRSVYIVSLGCPKNFVDTEVMAASLIVHGFGISNEARDADVYMINTCAFIPSAREEAEECIREALKWKGGRGGRRKVVIAGCLNQWDRQGDYRRLFPEVDLWVGLNSVPVLAERIAGLYKKGGVVADDFEVADYLYDDSTPRLQLTPRHYAYIKISEGCDNCCSYCSIPLIRGRHRSRASASVLREAENLLRGGVGELILIGQDITAYGADSGDMNLAELLRQLDRLEGNFRLRLLYTHPAHFTDELVEVMASSKHLLPYADMPLQHISDRILASMGRKVSRSRIEELIAKLRREIPGIALRTTFIVGYPGETEEDFDILYDFVKRMRFERLGVFTYFEEPGTPAAAMPDKVPEEVAEERMERLMLLQSQISLELNQAMIGREIEVAVDGRERGKCFGRSYMDAPEIDNQVVFAAGRRTAVGDVVKVKISSCSEYELEGVQSTD